MSRNEPVDPRVRLAICQWPQAAPRGAVTTFCAEQGITRKTFYAIRARMVVEGPAAVLQPHSRRPRSSPSKVGQDTKRQALDVRAALERSGLDHGPVSVFDKMRALGLDAPSTASLSRIFREAGVARVEPKKKPRAAYRRFVYPQPNCLWQLDATEYVLTGGRKCVIFQLIDDHARLAVASYVAWGETSDAAIAVVAKGIAVHGVPQRLLTDNGVALNPSRRGVTGQLVDYVTRLGVEAITGKPYKPTTQGKNERFHQTLFRWLDKQPLAATLDQLQAQVEEFDRIYNTERPHQGLPGRLTPQQTWDATPKADPPRPKTPAAPTSTPAMAPPASVQGAQTKKVRPAGGVRVHGVNFHLGGELAGEYVLIIRDPETISFINQATGEVIIEHPVPVPGIHYVGNGKPRGRRPAPNTSTSPMS